MDFGTLHLSEDDCSEIAELLAEAIPAEHLDLAILTVDTAFFFARQRRIDPKGRQATNELQRRHFLKVKKAALALRQVLDTPPTPPRTEYGDRDGRPRAGAHGIDWDRLSLTLERIISSADQELASSPTRGRHRPAKEWRDLLISVVYSAYPPGAATVEINSNFVRVIEMLLEKLGEDVQNVPDVIRRSLRRLPESPMIVSRANARNSAAS